MAKRILVVEDHEDTREILNALLSHYGFEMIEAETAEDALERIDAVDPDLVVLDVRLPGMDGCEALEQMRERGIAVPIFLFSEYYDLFANGIRNARPDAFFAKSKGPQELVQAIQQALVAPPPAIQ